MSNKLEAISTERTVALRHLERDVVTYAEKKFPASVTKQIPWDLLSCLADVEGLASSLRTTLKSIVRDRDVKSYLSLPSRPKQLYGSAEEYLQEAVVLNLLKKYPFGTLEGVDPKEEARKVFHAAERQCRRTNKRFLYYRERYFRLAKKRIGVDSILHRARQRIAQLIGFRPDLDLIYAKMNHGPGGVLETEDSTRTTFYYKVASDRYSVTSGCYPYALAAILADQRWRQMVWEDQNFCSALSIPSVEDSIHAVRLRLDIVTYNKVTFVPKTAKVHRIIAAEPMMNIYCQKGVGNFIRSRLKRVGINLDSQERNKHRAFLGSKWESDPSLRPCTLDLASASDTLSIELVRELLPDDWFDMLTALRCPQGLLEGKLILYEKFSSMGNGFTFELESMIFWALMSATAEFYGYAEDDVCVYGDDIIVPAGIALSCIEVLGFCGFKTNDEKSFVFGPFRESCGSDFFEGVPVRPFYLKMEVQSARDAVFVLNSIRSLRSGLGGYNDQDLGAYASLLRHIPKVVRHNLLGPSSESLDSHIFCSLDVAQKSRLVKWNRDLQCYQYPAIVSSAIEFRGRRGPRYLQFITAGTSAPQYGITAHRENRRSEESLRSLVQGSWSFSSGTSASTVTRRSRTRPTLACLFKTGWDSNATSFDVLIASS